MRRGPSTTLWLTASAVLLVLVLFLVGASGPGGTLASLRRLTASGVPDGTATAPAAGVAPSRSTIRLVGSFDGDVRRLPPIPGRPRPEGGDDEGAPPPLVADPSTPGPVQSAAAITASMPSAGASFDGLAYNYAGTPPDTVGDVGPNDYVQAVNTMVGIYSKTGTERWSGTFDTLWQGTASTPCNGLNYGDPTVVYDAVGNRWIVADFAFADPNVPPFYECIAVSKTSDPVLGGWWFYAVRTDDETHPWLADYPKMGIWPGSLLMTANMFEGNTYRGVRLWAFDLADLEGGIAPPDMVVRDLPTTYFSLLPVHVRGSAPPPGTPAYLVSQDQGYWRFDVWKWALDWSAHTDMLSGPSTVSQQLGYYVPGQEVVPQSGTSQKLDALGFRLMMQAQYRNLSGAESIWVAQTLSTGNGASAPTGVRWAQLNVSGGTVASTPTQQGMWTGGSDGLWRWIPSLAVDGAGNMAIGYSVSGSTMVPAIRYAGRLVSDPLNTLGQGETTLFQGPGNQINIGRWGDYASMSVDPSDGCTFWFTSEYLSSTTITVNGVARHPWRTRIGSFRFSSCGGTPPSTASVTVTKASLGSGAGTVSSSPSGISCGSTCSASFTSGASVTLTATAASGSVFAGWSGDVCGGSTSRTCSFSASGTISVTATFATTRKLTLKKVNGTYGTVTSSPTGISCGKTCSATYVYGTSVTLTATPLSGRGFTSWSGCDSTPTATTCVVSMTAARTVTATFRSTP